MLTPLPAGWTDITPTVKHRPPQRPDAGRHPVQADYACTPASLTLPHQGEALGDAGPMIPWLIFPASVFPGAVKRHWTFAETPVRPQTPALMGCWPGFELAPAISSVSTWYTGRMRNMETIFEADVQPLSRAYAPPAPCGEPLA